MLKKCADSCFDSKKKDKMMELQSKATKEKKLEEAEYITQKLNRQ